VSWNPVTGCSKVSRGCQHCYAERMANRLRAMGVERYSNGFDVTLHEGLIEEPFKWVKSRRVFVNSMSDLFHERIPEGFIRSVFETMRRCPQHTFQVLTKRSQRLRDMAPSLPWPANVWMGVTVEDEHAVLRLDDLRTVRARVRFASCEPLLDALPGLSLRGIHWVIVGGESGPGARPMKAEWVDGILKRCREASAAFFFKQWGGTRKGRTGRSFQGRTFDEIPVRAVCPLASHC